MIEAADQTAAAPTFGPWVEWEGEGVCPLRRRQLVQVRLRFEKSNDESQEPRRADAWSWADTGDAMEVRAYREVNL